MTGDLIRDSRVREFRRSNSLGIFQLRARDVLANREVTTPPSVLKLVGKLGKGAVSSLDLPETSLDLLEN